MRFLPALLFCFLIFSCGPDDHKGGSDKKSIIDTNFRLPSIVTGIAIDTSMVSLRISSVYESMLSDTAGSNPYEPTYLVEFDSSRITEVINVYADSNISVVVVDSIINAYWSGQDVCLIGISNGIELGIPFHGLHRFPPQLEIHNTLPEQYFKLRVYADYTQVNDWPFRYKNTADFFAPFYSDAFSPYDSSSKYPSRTRHSVDGLMMEGSAWDGVNLREGPDSAQRLASYNEFVNKLEIFDKAGPFWTMRVAMIDVTYDTTVDWRKFMKVASEHYYWLSSKRNAAKQYLSNYIANKGTEPKEFTVEDLHLLYPDRLRWNGFISGEFESRYDADMLTDWQ